jgi:hypothetical protein
METILSLFVVAVNHWEEIVDKVTKDWPVIVLGRRATKFIFTKEAVLLGAGTCVTNSANKIADLAVASSIDHGNDVDTLDFSPENNPLASILISIPGP